MAGSFSRSRCARTSKPFNSGIWISRKTRSGLFRWICSMASSPSEHSPAIWISFSPARSSRTLSLPRGSSSTINALILRIGGILEGKPRRGAVGDCERCRHAAPGQFGQFERLPRSIEPFEPRLCVRNSDPLTPRFDRVSGVGGFRLDSKPVVEDAKLERSVLLRSGYFQYGLAADLADPVLDGVFDERLKDHVRNTRLFERRGHGDGDFQPFAEPDLLDFEIEREKLQLFLQADLLRSDALERPAEKFAQLPQCRAGEFRILLDQHVDGVQRIEQEVGLELHLQSLELRLDEHLSKLDRLQLVLLGVRVVGIRVVEQEDDPVELDAVVEVREHDVVRRGPGKSGALERHPVEGQDDPVNPLVAERHKKIHGIILTLYR